MHSGPAKSTPAEPKITTSFSVMSNACCVSPITCFSSASSASPSRYRSARSLGVIFSAMNTFTLLRFISFPLNTIFNRVACLSLVKLSVTRELSMWMSVMTRDR